MNSRGFTLLEVLVAVAIASLAIGAAVLPIGAMASRAGLTELAAKLDHLLTIAREAAIRSGVPQRVHLENAERRLVIQGSTEALQIPEAATLTIDGTVLKPEGLADASIYFLADGSSTGGVIEIRQGKHLIKRSVSWITGHVDRQK
jgi:general secretion pathway protein H